MSYMVLQGTAIVNEQNAPLYEKDCGQEHREETEVEIKSEFCLT